MNDNYLLIFLTGNKSVRIKHTLKHLTTHVYVMLRLYFHVLISGKKMQINEMAFVRFFTYGHFFTYHLSLKRHVPAAFLFLHIETNKFFFYSGQPILQPVFT